MGQKGPLRAPCLIATLLATTLLAGCRSASEQPHVVAYVSVDQVYAEPVFRAFEQKTGIRVDPVYDVEANKVTGLANRIMAESKNPKAGVFWNGEFVQTINLAANGAFQQFRPAAAKDLPPELVDPNGLWHGATPRVRVWISAQGFKAGGLDFEDITKVELPANKIAISNPVFGTGLTQAAALYAARGAERTTAYYQAIVDRGIRVVDGNSVVRDLVVSGDVTLGLTDSDDACSAIRHKANVKVTLPKETIMFPASVAMVRDSPEARALIEYLLGPESEKILVEAGFCQLPLHKSSPKPCLDLGEPKVIKVRPEEIVKQIALATRDMKAKFLR